MYEKVFKVKKSIYGIDVVLKTAYAFLDENYLHVTENHEDWVIEMESKNEIEDSHLEQKFENELLAQAVRAIVYRQTHNVRDILMARAMTTTIVDSEDPIATITNDQNTISDEELDQVLTDWFTAYEKDT